MRVGVVWELMRAPSKCGSVVPDDDDDDDVVINTHNENKSDVKNKERTTRQQITVLSRQGQGSSVTDYPS